MSQDIDRETERLLSEAAQGNEAAVSELFRLHRARIKRLVRLRMDSRLGKRVDPSDVVQETLLDAHHRIAKYLSSRPLPFYPWLRQLALERLAQHHRFHIKAANRSIAREEAANVSDHCVVRLADELATSTASPLAVLERHESKARLQAALQLLTSAEREVLILKFLEQLSTREVAAVLGVSQEAVRARQVRALRKLLHLLQGE